MPRSPSRQGKIKSLEQIYLFSLPVKEYQIVDYFLVGGGRGGCWWVLRLGATAGGYLHSVGCFCWWVVRKAGWG